MIFWRFNVSNIQQIRARLAQVLVAGIFDSVDGLNEFKLTVEQQFNDHEYYNQYKLLSINNYPVSITSIENYFDYNKDQLPEFFEKVDLYADSWYALSEVLDNFTDTLHLLNDKSFTRT